jgi:hypothetical protein
MITCELWTGIGVTTWTCACAGNNVAAPAIIADAVTAK